MKTILKKPPKTLPEDIGILKEMASFQIPMKVNEMVRFQTYAHQYDLYYICPRCKISLERDFMSYCDRCGQRLDWKDYKKAKIVDSKDLHGSTHK